MAPIEESVSVPKKVEGHEELMAARISDHLLSVTKQYRNKTFEAKMYVFNRQTIRELRELIPENNRTLAARLKEMLRAAAPVVLLCVVLICCAAVIVKAAGR